MFTNTQLERYADVLLWGLETARHTEADPGEIVLIRFDLPAVRLAEILFARLIQKGIQVIQRMSATPEMDKQFYSLANDKQLVFLSPGDDELCRQLNGSIYLHAPTSLTHLAGIDPKRIGKALVARKPLRDILDRREEQDLFSWTLCTWPTEALATHAGLSMEAYTQQIVAACFLDHDDPVGQWQQVYTRVKSIKQWLDDLDITSLHIESEHIDLRITPGKKRKWLGLSGHNIPSFEIFVSPDYRGTEGTFYADQPSFRSGNQVRGVTLCFEKGRMVKATAEKGEAFLKKQLAMDNGSDKVGEFSLTDKRFSKISAFMANTLFDENYGGSWGNCHLAVGASYSDAYAGDPAKLTPELKTELGFNDSALHWDLVNTESKRVTAHLSNGKRLVIYENGIFQNA